MKTSAVLHTIRRHYLRTVGQLDRGVAWQITGRWMLYSALVGVLCALAAIAFSELIRWVTEVALVDWVGYGMANAESGSERVDLSTALRTTRPWLLLIIPPIGGLLSGYLVFRYAPEAEGHGTDAVIEAYHKRSGDIRPRVGLIKALASTITIGTGGSAGKEGPIAQIGAAIGSFLGRKLNLSRSDRRLLLIAGVAAGVGSIFRAPLGGAFFAVEVLYRDDIEARGLMPATIAAITGYSVYSMLWDSGSVFQVPVLRTLNPPEYLLVILFAGFCSLAGIAFIRTFYGIRTLFGRIPISPRLLPGLGGLIVGVIAFSFPAVLGSSYGWLQQAILGNVSITIMAVLVVAKVLATSATIGSGGSGGVFAPSIVIGGMLGGVFGFGGQMLFPEAVLQPEAFVLIGMATFFAGAANVPIATTIMLSEMTGSYKLLVPLILGGVITQLLARRWSLYQEQPGTRADSPAHRTEMSPDLVSTITVERIIDYPVYYHTIAPYHDIQEIMSVFTRTREVVLPVMGDSVQDRYVGLVLLDRIQPHLRAEATGPQLTAAEVMVPFEFVHLRDTLDHVLERFQEHEYPEIPVLDDEGVIVAFIRPSQVIAEYHRAYLREKASEEANRHEQQDEKP